MCFWVHGTLGKWMCRQPAQAQRAELCIHVSQLLRIFKITLWFNLLPTFLHLPTMSSLVHVSCLFVSLSYFVFLFLLNVKNSRGCRLCIQPIMCLVEHRLLLDFLTIATLIIRDHTYPLDDLYCYVNGWYSLPRHEIVNNFSYLEEVSNRFCDHLAEIVPGYHNISLTEFVKESNGDEKVLENLMKKGADTGYVPQSVIDGMYLHAATKCVMRGRILWPPNCFG